MTRLLSALSFLLLLLAASCGDSSPLASSGERNAEADGAVLMVDDVPVFAEEVDNIALPLRILFPEYVERHCRRLALTNVVLARAAVRSKHAEARELARQAAERAAEALLRGEALEKEPHTETGHWKKLGLETWSRIRDQELGTWSDPFEELGRFLLVKPTQKEVLGPQPGNETYTMEILDFPYLEPESVAREVDQAIDGSLLVVIDPLWSELVPEEWKYRMRGVSR